MTDDQINHLIAALELARRENIASYRGVLDHIDAVLRHVPPGQRRDVDALLGRMPCPAGCTCGYPYLTVHHAAWCELQSIRVVLVKHSDGKIEMSPDFAATEEVKP